MEWIDGHKQTIIEVSDKIWEYAEVGLQEFKSSKVLEDTLAAHGFEIESGVAGMPTAFTATWGSGKPVIGFLAEYDALPHLSNKAVNSKVLIDIIRAIPPLCDRSCTTSWLDEKMGP